MDKTLDPHINICFFLSQIKSDYERELLEKIIYTKSRLNSVKYIPFRDTWITDSDLEDIKKAVIVLSQLRLGMLYVTTSIKSFEAKKVSMYINTLYVNLLRIINKKNWFLQSKNTQSCDCLFDDNTAINIARTILKNFLNH